jgi:regulator of protease activity HflC (stomatin/prohibitin superfamily)
MSIQLLIGLVMLLIFAIIFILMTSVKIIQPYEQGLLIVLGNFKRVLNPGFNMVPPLISEVIKLDLRTQVMDVPRQEVITKDNSPTNVDAIIYIKVIDPKKAYFEVDDYRRATIYLGQTTLRSLIGNMELDEVLYNRDKINLNLRDILDKATDVWGVRIEAVEIREVDPVGPVKAAMEEQTSAERERRAAILRADGQKRSAILVAEGHKRSRILEAEGVRQAKILEAEGQRLAVILEGQGEAQKLRILSLGALPLDHKALTVLSLDTLKKMGDGQATKIIFPFEISRLVEGAADYLGISQKTKEHTAMSFEDLERIIGKVDDILGEIPTQQELKAHMASIEREMEAESKTTEDIAHIIPDKKITETPKQKFAAVQKIQKKGTKPAPQ